MPFMHNYRTEEPTRRVGAETTKKTTWIQTKIRQMQFEPHAVEEGAAFTFLSLFSSFVHIGTGCTRFHCYRMTIFDVACPRKIVTANIGSTSGETAQPTFTSGMSLKPTFSTSWAPWLGWSMDAPPLPWCCSHLCSSFCRHFLFSSDSVQFGIGRFGSGGGCV